MRLSVLALAAVLLIPTIVLAQHTASAPSAPPPSPPPSAAPSTPPPPPPAPPPPSPPPAPPAPSAAPSVSAPHISAPSIPSPPSVPESHVAPAPISSSSHASGSSAAEFNSGRPAPTTHAPDSDAQRIAPDQKISGENRIVAAPRIGEKPPEKEGEPKKHEPDWRRPICDKGDCKEPTPKPEPPKSELRRIICVNGLCPCPPGETATKGGCAAPVVNPTTPCEPGSVTNGVDCTGASTSCPAGQVWNGTSCTLYTQCPAGEVWNGASCVAPTSECLSYETGATPMIAELRNLRSDVQQACGQNPSGQKCMDLKQEQQQAFGRYNLLWNEAPVSCRATFLPDPGSLI